MGQGRVYIRSPTEKKMGYLNGSLRDVLGLKWNIIKGNSAGTIKGTERIVFKTIETVSHQTIVYLFIHPLLRHQELKKPMSPPLRVLEQKTTHKHIHHYKTKHL